METNYLTFAPTLTERDAAGLPKRFSGVAYSGGVVPDYGWFGDVAIDLSTLKLPEGAIFALLDHDPSQRVGKLTPRIEGNKLLIEGEFFASTAAGKEVAGLFAEDAPWQLSVGIQATAVSGDKKRTVKCNSQTLEIDTLLSDASLREVSFVPVGADPHTSAQAFARKPSPSKGNTMTIEELQAQVADLTAKLSEQTQRADAAVAEATTMKAAARTAQLAQLSADLGRELSDGETKTLSALGDDAYQVIALSLKGSPRQMAAAHLFSAQATGGKNPEKSPAAVIDMAAIYAARQVQGAN